MPIEIEKAPIEGLLIVTNRLFPDPRGYFTELYREDQFEAAGLPSRFLQQNMSQSQKNVVRGLHFQWDKPMAKLMRVSRGTAFLVAVDIRHNSPTLGKWFGMEASAEDHRALYAPPGFARGFCALSDTADITYLCTAIYNPKGESGILWNDPQIALEWPVKEALLSDKDAAAQTLAEWLAREESKTFHI